jgi:hypothetical protein
MAKAAARTKKTSKRARQPVLQRFQVLQKSGRFYIIDVERGVTAGGPFSSRSAAQSEADRLERNAPAPRRN